MEQSKVKYKKSSYFDITKACDVMVQQVSRMTKHRLDEAEFNKTYYGLISKVHFDNDTLNNSREYQLYSIRYNGCEQEVYIRDGIIHSVGDRVLVTLPNGKLENLFVEVLTPNDHPIKIELQDNGKKIVETWMNNVGTTVTREYIIETDDNGNYSKIIFPDGCIMNVKGF